ncbi:hypothetical protein, partial [uncultured Aliiroseovarius sp.]|uniref:hypothetical protein n=1 Tax=uncultured Aliiroseovarius sp. TaxID=1658783 RepID=UPI00259773FB
VAHEGHAHHETHEPKPKSDRGELWRLAAIPYPILNVRCLLFICDGEGWLSFAKVASVVRWQNVKRLNEGASKL